MTMNEASEIARDILMSQLACACECVDVYMQEADLKMVEAEITKLAATMAKAIDEEYYTY